ncbi:hypothetical protein [Streptomyces griseoluteus]|nr:hypothetical protein [Streptomyces griseoluteus]
MIHYVFAAGPALLARCPRGDGATADEPAPTEERGLRSRPA